MSNIEHWIVTVDPAGELRAVGDVTDPELGHPLGWRAVEVVPSATYQGAVDLIRRFAEHDLPGNPPSALLDLFIAAEDFIHEHDHPREAARLKAENEALTILAGANENTMRQWEGELERLRRQLAGAVTALRGYGGHREDCNALSGAPECSCGFDEAMLRALGRAGV